jgi:hypothetical protein
VNFKSKCGTEADLDTFPAAKRVRFPIAIGGKTDMRRTLQTQRE